MGVICVYSLETGQVSQVTDGMSDAKYPAFDRSGKYLYFTASTDVGLTPGWLNMSSMDRPVTRSVYVAVLKKDLPSPLAPESDEEKPKEEEKKADTPKADAKKGAGDAKDKDDKAKDAAKEPEKVVIDLDGIGQRILALPVPAQELHRPRGGEGRHRFPARSDSGIYGHAAQFCHRTPSTNSTWRRARSISTWTGSAPSSFRPLARRSCSIRDRSGRSPRRRARSSPARARSRPARWRSGSSRSSNGNRCITKSGASSGISSTTPAPTAST